MIITLENIRDLAVKCEVFRLSPVVYEKNIFKITEPVTIELSDKSLITLGAGWEYDGASVPWIFQPLFPKWGLYSYNSLPHDFCYYCLYKGRKFADKEHFLWGKAIGLKPLDNYIRYYFLRAFGWIYWNRSRNRPSIRAWRNRLLTTIIQKPECYYS